MPEGKQSGWVEGAIGAVVGACLVGLGTVFIQLRDDTIKSTIAIDELQRGLQQMVLSMHAVKDELADHREQIGHQAGLIRAEQLERNIENLENDFRGR